MSFDLGHISHASHAEPVVLPVEGSGYGAGDGGLSYTRGPVEAQDLPLGGAPQLAHCDELLQRERRSCSSASEKALMCGYFNVFWMLCVCVLLTKMRFLTSSIP